MFAPVAPLPSPEAHRRERLLAHDRPVPRYTSYPAVPAWSTSPPADAWDQLLDGLHEPAHLYVHVPFCRRQCLYCGCNMAVSRNQAVGDRYVDALLDELGSLPTLRARELHLGGGTPTWLDGAQLERLLAAFRARFGPLRVSVEADPMTLDEGRLRALRGIHRLSLGVQTLDPVVTDAVGRDQTAEQVAMAVRVGRELGIESLNIDLMYGLPHQTPERFRRTLEQVNALRPERIAVFGYAHVPQMMRHQRQLTDLPDAEARLELALLAESYLTGAGYVKVGFDHYALPGDPLASGPIERGFMGYTPKTLPIVGLGPSAISAVHGVYLQSEPHLGRWLRGEGRRPVHRFYRSDDDDRARGAIIEQLLCHGRARVDWDRFPEARERLEAELSGIVHLTPFHVAVDPAYRLLTRNVASAFDRWGGRKGSRAI